MQAYSDGHGPGGQDGADRAGAGRGGAVQGAIK